MSIRSLHVMSILLNSSPAAPAIKGTLPDTLAEVECSVGRIGDTVRDTSVVIRATLITLSPDTPVVEIEPGRARRVSDTDDHLQAGAKLTAAAVPAGIS